jgi:hypothetical protein
MTIFPIVTTMPCNLEWRLQTLESGDIGEAEFVYYVKISLISFCPFLLTHKPITEGRFPRPRYWSYWCKLVFYVEHFPN